MKKRTDVPTFLLLLAACVGILAVVFVQFLMPRESSPYRAEMVVASELMEEGLRLIKDRREATGIPIDRHVDLNNTGLIGVEYSDITTSTGNIEAKRSVLNPEFAALMVRLYHEAGVSPGDTIAIGASGSFPGALVASLAAAQAMELKVLLIVSYGASNWGANIAEFNIMDMYEAVAALFPVELLAVSLGGRYDNGNDMMEEGRMFLINDMHRRNAVMILEPDLGSAVDRRLSLYELYLGDGTILSAFVNIGGADANIGEGLGVLDLTPGVNHVGDAPARSLQDGGVVFALGAEGVPIIHILNIKTLLSSYRMSWDPVPLPRGTNGDIYHSVANAKGRAVWIVGSLVVYVLALCLMFFAYRSRTGKLTGGSALAIADQCSGVVEEKKKHGEM